MSSHMVRGRLQSASAPLAALDDAPVKHFHLKERSSIPSVLRGADAFTITRMESSNGLAERITKISSVPALLVAVSIKSLAIADCQFWVDDKPVPTPYVPSFRSNIIDLDAQPGCWWEAPSTTCCFMCLAVAWTTSRPISAWVLWRPTGCRCWKKISF